MKVLVIGVGYVGLVTAVCLAEIGHEVTCLDYDKRKIELLKSNKAPIYEKDLEKFMLKNKKRLKYTMNSENVYQNIDAIFICVGTPEREDGSANLKYIYDAVKELTENIKSDVVLVIKSTVPIGTNDEIENYIKNNLKSDVNIEVVSNPEFLSQGTAIRDTLYAQRIVLGVFSKKAEIFMHKMYDKMKRKYVITDRKSAEMIKYASNVFLALKISYINEIANLSEIVGANIDDVSKGMGLDLRIGKQFLKAGIGYGGSCFPKDTKALYRLASSNDYELKMVKSTIEVNESQRKILIKKSKKYYESLLGVKVAILGVTFKANTDDLRESPAIDSISLLLKEGACVKVFDPVGNSKLQEIYKSKIKYCNSLEEVLMGAEIAFIFTEWNCIKNMNIKLFANLMKRAIVLDGRNCFELKKNPNGMIYESVGRKIVNKLVE